MKRKFVNILTISVMLTTIGFLMDGDIKEPSMMMRFVEFFGMIGILFIVVSIFYFASASIYKNIHARVKGLNDRSWD